MMVCIDPKIIQRISFDYYSNSLTTSGKIKTKQEWTVLSTIVMLHGVESYKVVALGTGTKCIGENSLCQHGLVVNDSHAEVIARRSFLCFLYKEIKQAYEGSNSIFVICDNGRCKLMPGISFHFFTTHVPCNTGGDASIIEKGTAVENACLNENIGYSLGDKQKCDDVLRKRPVCDDLEENNFTTSKKMKNNEAEEFLDKLCKADDEPLKHQSTISKVQEIDISSYKNKISVNNHCNGDSEIADIHRTGAKCVSSSDPCLPGLNYHITGVLRTKPGRGFRSLSLSCSDKICKWNVLGLQGALLMHFLEFPIYLDSFVISSAIFCEKTFDRAVYERISKVSGLPSSFTAHKPQVFHLKEDVFEGCRKQDLNQTPSAAAISWFASSEKSIQEVIVKGKPLGLTKKSKSHLSCSISKASLYTKFLELKSIFLMQFPVSNLNDVSLKSYNDHKAASTDYQQAWTLLKNYYLIGWPCTSRSYYQFV